MLFHLIKVVDQDATNSMSGSSHKRKPK